MLVYLDDIRLNAVCDGPDKGAPVVLIHGLGTDLTLWDRVVEHLPGRRVLRFDLRGHGKSDVAAPPYAMGSLIHDAERVIAQFAMRDAVIVGHGAGGLVAQGLAVKRLDLVRELVLSNTASRIGQAELWRRQIDLVQSEGLNSILDGTMRQWFGPRWRDAAGLQKARAMFAATPADGWAGVAAATAGSDFYQTTATLRLPVLVVASTNDGVTPPDMQHELAGLIPGAEFQLIQGAGHLAPLDQPERFSECLAGFLDRIGHV